MEPSRARSRPVDRGDSCPDPPFPIMAGRGDCRLPAVVPIFLVRLPQARVAEAAAGWTPILGHMSCVDRWPRSEALTGPALTTVAALSPTGHGGTKKELARYARERRSRRPGLCRAAGIACVRPGKSRDLVRPYRCAGVISRRNPDDSLRSQVACPSLPCPAPLSLRPLIASLRGSSGLPRSTPALLLSRPYLTRDFIRPQ